MAHFPVTNSNLSAIHLADFLLNNYTLGIAAQCRILKAGINDTYLVKSSAGKYVFRVYSYNWRTRIEISEELKLLERLHQSGISVSYPIKDNKDNYIQELDAPEGLRFGVMFSYAEGDKLPGYSDEVHYNAGVLMAQIHKVVQNHNLARVTYTSKVLLDDSLNEIAQFLPEDTEEMIFLRSTRDYLAKEFEGFKTDELRRGIVHMDIWFDNLNVAKDNKITLFDFDFCGNGWLCLDIAYYIMMIHYMDRDEVSCQGKINSFLKGYESITPIGAEEKRIIPSLGVAMLFFYLGTQCERYDNWSNVFLNDAHLKRYVNLVIKRYHELSLKMVL